MVKKAKKPRAKSVKKSGSKRKRVTKTMYRLQKELGCY